MFTGLVEEVGTVKSLKRRSGKTRLMVAATQLTRELRLGDSIAVSGVCLTAVEVKKKEFGADLAAETIARTSLTRLQTGSLINLELPTRADGRLGGHVVQGHVDGVAKLASLERVEDGVDYWLELDIPKELVKYVVFKGSIAIEGISLTVARVAGTRVGVAIIPHTFEATNLKSLKRGDPLNIEVDILAKYAEKMLRGEEEAGGISLERLQSEGF